MLITGNNLFKIPVLNIKGDIKNITFLLSQRKNVITGSVRDVQVKHNKNDYEQNEYYIA